ncbi:MAG: hypothetical protein BWX66_00564 [Deltaproteobacteria bacterium ADurb.Bin058]|nr:MAG: hypothetical protein BWX66_00564 [Deltaproteobacteria bacterium ADurb.Bin058]
MDLDNKLSYEVFHAVLTDFGWFSMGQGMDGVWPDSSSGIEDPTFDNDGNRRHREAD